MSTPDGPDRLDTWIETACAELGVEPGDEYTKTILNLARVIAHKVDRRGAPLTSYLLGLAVVVASRWRSRPRGCRTSPGTGPIRTSRPGRLAFGSPGSNVLLPPSVRRWH